MYPCRVSRPLTQLHQLIVYSQQLLESIVVDHHGGSSLRYFLQAAKQCFPFCLTVLLRELDRS
jgi:hypothetical protein